MFGGESNKDNTKLKLKEVLTAVERDYLKGDGSSGATGPLDMNDNKISKVIDPVADQDVVTKKYMLTQMQETVSENLTSSMKTPKREGSFSPELVVLLSPVNFL